MTDVRSLSDEQLLEIIRGHGGMLTTQERVADVGAGLITGGVNAATGIAGLPGDIQALAGAGANRLMGDEPRIAPPFTLPTSQALKGEVERYTGPLPQPKTTAGKATQTITEFAPSAALPGGPVRRAINVLAPAGGAELGEAVTGSPYGRAAGALLGGIAGARGITPAAATPERAALAGVLEREGVPLTAGQRTGNRPLMWFEQAAADTPFAAGRAARMNEAQGRAFSGAVMRRIGAAGDEIATPDAVNRAVQSLSNRFEQLSARNTLVADRQLGTDFINTAQRYVDSVIPSQRVQGRQNIETIMRDVVDEIQANNGQMTGQLYQATRSRLGGMADSVRESDPQLSTAIRGIRDALDNGMRRSIAPADRAAWDEARTQWRNWKALEKAMSGAGSSVAEGFVSPSQLRTAVAGQNRGQYTRGQGDMAELARAGEALLRPLPQSGTAPRQAAGNLFASMAGGLAGHSTGMGPEAVLAGMAAPAIAGRAMLSTPMQAYLGNQLLPMPARDVARLLATQQILGRPRQ